MTELTLKFGGQTLAAGLLPARSGFAAADLERLSRLRALGLLRDSIARAGYQAPVLMGSAPTLGSPTSSTAIATGTTWQPATGGAALHASKYTFLGANWKCVSSGYPNGEMYKPEVAHLGNGTDPANSPLYSGKVRFSTEAPIFEIFGQHAATGNGNSFRLKVLDDNGRLQYAKTGTLGIDGNGVLRFQPVQWGDGSATYRKLRHYELEFYTVGQFGGIRTGPLYKPAPWPQADGLRVMQHGDSFVNTIVDSGSLDAALTGSTGSVIADMIGQADYWASGTGGAGWFTPSGHTQSWFNDRVALDVVANAPDVIIEHGGGNDQAQLNAGTVTQAQQQAAVEAWLSAALTAKPETIIFMTGPLIASVPGLGHTRCMAAKQAAAAKWPKNVAFIDNLTDPWIFGAGRQGATASDGDRDWRTGSDGAHPTLEGHAALSGRIVRAIAGSIPALIAANAA